MASLSIQNDNGTFSLTGKYIYNISEYSKRIKATERYGVDGVSIQGDRRAGSRTITLAFPVFSQNAATVIDDLNTFTGYFDTTAGDVYLIDNDNSRRIQVELKKVSSQPEQGTIHKYEQAQATLMTYSPFWEDTTATVTTATLSNGETLDVVNSGQVVTYPEIAIQATGANPSFRIDNNSVAGETFTIAASNFTTGSQITYSSITGKATLNNVLLSQNPTKGGPIVLNPGTNTLKYISSYGSVNITVTHRNKYIW